MFKTRQFLQDQFTDPDGLVCLVEKHCSMQPQKEAVRKWFQRGSVPSDWWPLLIIAALRETGEVPPLGNYLGGVNDIFG